MLISCDQLSNFQTSCRGSDYHKGEFVHVNISLIIFVFMVSGGYVHGQPNWDDSPPRERGRCRMALASSQSPLREPRFQNHEHQARWSLKRARQLSDQGEARSAIAVLERLLDVQPRNAQAHTKIAQLYLQARQPELAESHAQKVIEIEGPTDRNLLNLIQIQQVNNPQNALETTKDASTRYPGNIFFLNKKGQLLRRLTNYIGAYQAIELALAIDSQNTVSLTEMAHILAYLGSYHDSLAILDRLEKLNVKFSKIQNIRTLIRVKLATKSRGEQEKNRITGKSKG
jgi:tetratricopeptide (TPR) repeat protein